MHIGIVGAGAIGGMVGGKLALAGNDVTFIARGAHLEAMRRDGLRLVMNREDGGNRLVRPVRATDDFRHAGRQDLVILSLKAHQIAAVAGDMHYLYRPHTPVVTMQNGIPWWYFHNHGGPFDGHALESLDPDGVLAANIPAERIIGCIAYPAAVIDAPGIVRQIEGNRFPVGELDGAQTERIEQISRLFAGAGFKSRILDDIRAEIWLKAWGNLAFNPISAMTHATLAGMCRFPQTRDLARNMMEEAQAVAHKLGIQFRHTIERRISGAEGVGEHKTSMLQDMENGRELEIDALIGAVAELGRLTQTATPHIDAVHACISLLADTMQKMSAPAGTVEPSAGAGFPATANVVPLHMRTATAAAAAE